MRGKHQIERKFVGVAYGSFKLNEKKNGKYDLIALWVNMLIAYISQRFNTQKNFVCI